MAGTTCLALLFPVSEWAVIWRLNPEAHSAFQTMGFWAIVLMFWWRLRVRSPQSASGIVTRWAHRLAIAVVLVNMLGDLGNAIVSGDLRTLIGIPIVAAMIWYLVTSGIRRRLVATKGDR